MSSNIKTVVIMRRQDRIDYVMNGICDYYKITKDKLIKGATSGKRFRIKRIAVKILRDIADISYKEIAYTFNVTSLPGIWHILMDMTEDLNDRTSATKEIREEYKNVVKYLNL